MNDNDVEKVICEIISDTAKEEGFSQYENLGKNIYEVILIYKDFNI